MAPVETPRDARAVGEVVFTPLHHSGQDHHRAKFNRAENKVQFSARESFWQHTHTHLCSPDPRESLVPRGDNRSLLESLSAFAPWRALGQLLNDSESAGPLPSRTARPFQKLKRSNEFKDLGTLRLISVRHGHRLLRFSVKPRGWRVKVKNRYEYKYKLAVGKIV